MKKILLPLVALGLLSQTVQAGTTASYQAHCKYYNSLQKLRYSGRCGGNWGVVGTSNGWYERYILTYPNGNGLTVYINSDGSATVNDIPAISLKAKQGYKRVLTTEGEVFEFTGGSE